MRTLILWPGCGANPSLGAPILMSILKSSGHPAILFNSDKYFDNVRSTRGALYKSSENKNAKPTLKAYEQGVNRAVDDLKEKIELFKPDVLALSAFSINFLVGMDMITKLPRKLFLLVGGVHRAIANFLFLVTETPETTYMKFAIFGHSIPLNHSALFRRWLYIPSKIRSESWQGERQNEK